MPSRIFLLSPASLTGLRTKQLSSPRAQFPAAVRYRSAEGVTIAEAFTFMSALYFRGKIGYALHFARPPASLADLGVYVITTGFGLVPPDWILTPERLQRMGRIDIDASSRNYTRPLKETARAIASRLEEETEVILLGSVATGKYVDILQPIFGSRLRFPRVFAGLGDMARGGLMLRAVRANKELEYTTLDAPRHRTGGGSGKMPAL